MNPFYNDEFLRGFDMLRLHLDRPDQSDIPHLCKYIISIMPEKVGGKLKGELLYYSEFDYELDLDAIDELTVLANDFVIQYQLLEQLQADDNKKKSKKKLTEIAKLPRNRQKRVTTDDVRTFLVKHHLITKFTIVRGANKQASKHFKLSKQRISDHFSKIKDTL